MEQHSRTWEESPNIAKWRRKQGANRPFTVDFDAIFFITRYRINPCLYSGFLWARCSPRDIEQRVGPSGFTWQMTSTCLAGDVIQVWINSSPSNHCISHFKAQLAQLFFIQHLICTYWIKGILCGYAIRSGSHHLGSQRPGPTCGRPGGRWLPSGCLPDRIA